MNEDLSINPKNNFIGNTSPRELLSRAENGDANATAEVYRLGKNQKNAVRFYSELQVATGTQRRALFSVLKDGPSEFRKSMITTAKKESGDGLGKIVVGSIGASLSLGLLSLTAIVESSSFSSTFLCILFAFMAFSAITLVIEGAKKIQCAKETKGHLQYG